MSLLRLQGVNCLLGILGSQGPGGLAMAPHALAFRL